MSAQLKTIHKKRAASETTSSTPAPEGDHRKRRRNRTTQSCLNCHTSKRMKAPLRSLYPARPGTGLCIYEVDDPTQRGNTQDESSRLRKRVAELEGVIRELKNKPHPRWTKSASSPVEEVEKWHARTPSRTLAEDSLKESCNDSDTSHHTPDLRSNSNKQSSGRQHVPNFYQPEACTPFPELSLDCSSGAPGAYSSYFGLSSPLSTPSSAVMTPTDAYSPPITIAGDQRLPHDLNLASIFMSCPGSGGRDDGLGYIERALRSSGILDHDDAACLAKPNPGRLVEGHCGCLNEAASYNVVLELSIRLRRAADVLRRASSHRFHNGCTLNQKIIDLDILATTTLGNMTTCPNDLGHFPLRCRNYVDNAGSNEITTSSFPSSSYPAAMPVSTVSPQSLQGIRSWDIISSISDPPSAYDDSFMSWEPPRRG
ncbi:hypothetical protein F5I97DRAFT_2004540 [Phlebopus sp. FC_14]|nr:hypothetical protein F5I97DRAFT_2004540 [Phlebopus sp. FC_14]